VITFSCSRIAHQRTPRSHNVRNPQERRELDRRTIIQGGAKLAERASQRSAKLAGRARDEAYFAAVSVRSGAVGLEPPRKAAKMLLELKHYGLLGGTLAAAAIRTPHQLAVIDERGELTYEQLHLHTNAIANAWRDRGLAPGEGVAVLARNHRGFLEAVFAAAKCGARIVLLNTSFAGPQICDVARREGTDLLVYDDEYADMLEGIDPPRGRFRAWVDEPGDDTLDAASGDALAAPGNAPLDAPGDDTRDTSVAADDTLDALIATGDTTPPPPPETGPRVTILTSGTTGTPKGAPREEPKSLGLLGGLLSKVPFKAGEVTELCAPMFHALGFAQAIVGIGLGSTLVLRRHFDPLQTLQSLERHRATAMVMVPVMLQRTVDIANDTRYDTSSLRIIFLSGSALGADLACRAMDTFGPVVYNLYGSTEISYATIATPDDLRAAPSTVGKVVRGSVVRILDSGGRELPWGRSGRIFVGNISQFEGYTGGGGKEEVGGLISSGDVGHFDAQGRLYIDGRDDEMIVSGGENVFPAEVEQLLAGHEQIGEAAAIGVQDERFGQRLVAFVALREGASLSEDEIKDYVKRNLARYKAPRAVIFVDELPRNATGKVLKRELAERAGEAAGEAAQRGAAAREQARAS
jgi:fatty-acyl-CoA synthase